MLVTCINKHRTVTIVKALVARTIQKKNDTCRKSLFIKSSTRKSELSIQTSTRIIFYDLCNVKLLLNMDTFKFTARKCRFENYFIVPINFHLEMYFILFLFFSFFNLILQHLIYLLHSLNNIFSIVNPSIDACIIYKILDCKNYLFIILIK